MAGATGAMTGFAFPEILVQIVTLFRAGEIDERRRRLLPGRAADAVRVPGRDRHGDPQGSAAPARRARRAPPTPRARARGARQDDARGARSRAWRGSSATGVRVTDLTLTRLCNRQAVEELMDLGLKGKVAMVAGASRGLGFAVARGAGARRRARLDRVARRAGDRGGRGAADRRRRARRCRSTSGRRRRSSSGPRTTAQRFGGVDLLFTNSGGPPAGAGVSFDDARVAGRGGPAAVQHASAWCAAAVPSMQARGGGAILMSTSSSVKEPIPNLGLSTVLRASVSALAKTLALELAATKIRVNQIIPGRIDTDRVRQLDEIDAKKQGITAGRGEAQVDGGDPDGPLRRDRRVRPRRRVPAVGLPPAT